MKCPNCGDDHEDSIEGKLQVEVTLTLWDVAILNRLGTINLKVGLVPEYVIPSLETALHKLDVAASIAAMMYNSRN